MSKKLLLILAMALSAALIAAGCGDDDSTTSTSAESTSAETTTEDTAATSTDAVTGADAASVEAACKQAIEAQGVPISDDVKAEIEQICQDAAANGDDPEALQAASQKVCELVVEDNLPEGPTRDQALKTCETAGQ
jgi:ABC-type glycerol-3-phosphate transport system substrate-binding protein